MLITLGMSVVQRDRLAEAIEHTRRALALFEEAGQLYGQANALTGLAHTYGRMGEYATSFDHAQRALALYQEIEHITGHGSCSGLEQHGHGTRRAR